MKQQRNDLPPHLKQIKTNKMYETVVSKILGVRQWQTVILEKSKHAKRALRLPELWWLSEGFQAVAQVGGTQMESSGPPDWRRWSWESEETEVARVCRTCYQRGESCPREKPRDLQKIPSVHAWEKARIRAWHSHSSRNSVFFSPPGRLKNIIIHGALGG